VSEVKPSNPKDAVGIKRVPFSVIPAEVLGQLGIAMMEGALKYGRHNYRAVGLRGSVYYDAIMRHLTAWWEGEDIDPESGEHHLIKLMAGAVCIMDSINRGNWTDDRPPRLAAGWQKPLNEKAAALIEKYPDPKAAYTQIDMSWTEITVKTPKDGLYKFTPDNPNPLFAAAPGRSFVKPGFGGEVTFDDWKDK
jgi:hypothetical protein